MQKNALAVKELHKLSCSNVDIKPLPFIENGEEETNKIIAEFCYSIKKFTTLPLTAKLLKKYEP